MRILQVLPHLSKGGAERVVVDLSNSLVKVGHEVTVLLAFQVNPSLNQEYLDHKVKVQFVSPNGGSRILQYVKLPFWVVRHWKLLNTYDVIHCHLTFGLIFGFIISLFRTVVRKKNPKLVATCHMVGVGGGLKVMNEKLSSFFNDFVLMAEDDAWRQFAENKGRKNIVVIPNGVSIKTTGTGPAPRKDKPFWTVGTISRLKAERKPWLFLETFSEILESMDGKVRFVIGGEGPERISLSALSEKLGLNESLTMPGLVHDPLEILNNLDIYITLNVEGITGIAGLEAVFAGIPVVGIQLSPTYRTGAVDWIWSDHDPKLVAQKIVELLSDNKKLERVRQDQFLVANRDYSINRMRDEYLKIYGVSQ